MSDQSRHTDTDRILRTADDAITTLRIIFKTENEFGKNLRIHVWQLHRPDFLDHIAGRSRESTTLTHFESWHQRHGDSPSWCIAAYVRLINPGTRQVKTSRKLTGRILDISTGTGCQSLSRRTLQFYILNATLLAELALGFTSTIHIDNKDIRLHHIYRRNKVHDAVTLIDESILYISDRLHHKKAFLFRIERLMMLITEDGLIRPNTHIEFTKL